MVMEVLRIHVIIDTIVVVVISQLIVVVVYWLDLLPVVQDAGDHSSLKINIVILVHQVTFGVYVIANAILDNQSPIQ